MQGRLLLNSMLVSAGIVLLFSSLSLYAQDPPPDSSSKPADAPTPKKPGKKDTATTNASDQPIYDPLRAEKDLEVGQYYMRKGDVDAAIDRFQDATTAKPGYAIPFRYLGDAQEKKGLKKQAIASYSRYLDLYPHAEDRNKITRKINKLRNEVDKKKK
jgi:tetratricopeptide (TPR) repeat protein